MCLMTDTHWQQDHSSYHKAPQTFQSLNRVLWYQRKVTNLAENLISVILPTLLYSMECAVVSLPQVDCLKGFVMHCLYIILKVSALYQQCNTTIQRRAKMQWISSLLLRCRLLFLGHLFHKNDSCLPRHLLVCTLPKCSRPIEVLEWYDF